MCGKDGLAERLTNPGRKGESRKTSAWSSPTRHQSGQGVVPREQVSGRWPTCLRGACVQGWKGSPSDEVGLRRRLPRDCEGRRGGVGRRRPGDWIMCDLTWRDSGAIFRARAKRSSGNLRLCGLRECGGQRAGVRAGGVGGESARLTCEFLRHTQPRRPRFLSSSNSNSHNKMREVG